MLRPFLHTLSEQSLPPHSGGKATQIQQLISLKMRVPVTHVCVWDAYEAALRDETAVLTALRAELHQKLDLSKAYAVRSSANVEDSERFSFAGQFTTVLDVRGVDGLLDAIRTVWASTRDPNLLVYLNGSGMTPADLRMAVILQEMVPAAVSGVAFSKNPMTGLDEVVVEAVTGSGEALVQNGSTPDRWVHKWGDWTQRPSDSPIDTAVIAEVVAQTKATAAAVKRPLDLEWVSDDTAVYWVQLREITTLNQVNIYSNRIAREVLPGIIKPLVWSVNVPLVNSAWIRLFTELIGPNTIAPEDLSKAFYYRAYFNMGVIGQIFAALGMPRETLELLMGLEGGSQTPRFRPSGKVIAHVPRMLVFAARKLRYGRTIEAFLPQMDRAYADFASRPFATMPATTLLETLDALIAFTQQAAYLNIVGPLLMQLYNGLLRRQLTRAGVDWEQFDVTSELPEMAQYDPNRHLEALNQAFRALDPTLQAKIRTGGYATLQTLETVPVAFRTAVADFVAQFGHLSDSGNDFSRVPWREDPDFVLSMIMDHRDQAVAASRLVRGAGKATEADAGRVTWESAPLSRSDRRRTGWLYRRARQFRLYREAISFKYTYGYGLARHYALALGDRLVAQGVLAGREDIFYLYLPEVRGLVAGDSVDAAALVAARKAEIAAVTDVVLPEIIFGDEAPPLETYDTSLERLTGIATSGGYYRGPVCVVRNRQEFEKMTAGAVLVIPYSDVSWAPLFAKAGAVIAESGGMLSHSSIVAREYRVPAVVSVNGACHLLQDGMQVTVDGFKGELHIGERVPANGTREKKETEA